MPEENIAYRVPDEGRPIELGELKPVRMEALPATWFDTLAQKVEAIEHLTHLGLRMYESRDDEYLLALDDPLVHDHDRYLLCARGHDGKALRPSWYMPKVNGARHEGLTAGETLLVYIRSLSRFVQLVNGARVTFQEPAMTATQVLCYANLVDARYYVMIARIKPLGVDKLHDLHDLVNHVDVWLHRHPEASGLPHATLLRMHGLGALLEFMPQRGV